MFRTLLLSLACLLALVALTGLPEPRVPLGAISAGNTKPASTMSGNAATASDRAATPTRAASAALLEALRSSARICKPGGPWGAHLQPRAFGPGDAVHLDVVLKPLLPNDGLRWALELPPGTVLLAGHNAGELAGTPGLEVRVALSLRLPPGLDAGSVRLDVTPLNDPRLSSSRELDFGVAPAVGASQLFVADTGAQQARIVLPSTTREGR